MKTLVTFLLDRSGSMASVRSDTIGGFNSYIDALKSGDAADDITFNFIQFDNISTDTLEKNTPVKDVKPLTTATFEPRGMTPLIDACMKTILAVEAALAERDDKPKVDVTFQTDGIENCSTEYKNAELAAKIKEKTAEGWVFTFLGCGIDAYGMAGAMGISALNTMSFDSTDNAAVASTYASMARGTMAFAASGMARDKAFLSTERTAAGEEKVAWSQGGTGPAQPIRRDRGHQSAKSHKKGTVDKVDLT